MSEKKYVWFVDCVDCGAQFSIGDAPNPLNRNHSRQAIAGKVHALFAEPSTPTAQVKCN